MRDICIRRDSDAIKRQARNRCFCIAETAGENILDGFTGRLNCPFVDTAEASVRYKHRCVIDRLQRDLQIHIRVIPLTIVNRQRHCIRSGELVPTMPKGKLALVNITLGEGVTNIQFSVIQQQFAVHCIID